MEGGDRRPRECRDGSGQRRASEARGEGGGVASGGAALQSAAEDQVLTELEGNQEYQKWLIQLQADVLAGQPLATTLTTLVKVVWRGDL